VELTEASLVSPNTRIRHELTEMRNAGIPILLDDFGTGVSPLSYLRDLPVSGVKLDMSFTAGIPEDPAGARVSRALGALARELGLQEVVDIAMDAIGHASLRAPDGSGRGGAIALATRRLYFPVTRRIDLMAAPGQPNDAGISGKHRPALRQWLPNPSF
jgi:hypothetical protein